MRATFSLCQEWQKKGGDPHVKIPKHNVTVLFTETSVNMRDYELLGSEI